MSPIVRRMFIAVGLLFLVPTIWIIALFAVEEFGAGSRSFTRDAWWANCVTAAVYLPAWLLLWRGAFRPIRISRLRLICVTAGSGVGGAGTFALVQWMMSETTVAVVMAGMAFGGLWTALSPWCWRTAATLEAPTVPDPLCPKCEYNLRGLHDTRCPECGTQFTIDELVAFTRQRERPL